MLQKSWGFDLSKQWVLNSHSLSLTLDYWSLWSPFTCCGQQTHQIKMLRYSILDQTPRAHIKKGPLKGGSRELSDVSPWQIEPIWQRDTRRDYGSSQSVLQHTSCDHISHWLSMLWWACISPWQTHSHIRENCFIRTHTLLHTYKTVTLSGEIDIDMYANWFTWWDTRNMNTFSKHVKLKMCQKWLQAERKSKAV